MVSTDDDTANKVSSEKEDHEKGLFDEDDDNEGKPKKHGNPLVRLVLGLLKITKKAGRKEEKTFDVRHITTKSIQAQ